jgi:hypothetical protein
MVQERERCVLKLLERHGFGQLDATRVIEIGCGGRTWLRDFNKWGARPEHLTGVDLLPERIAEAVRTCHPGVTHVFANADALYISDA